MLFADAIRWLVRARDFAYERRGEAHVNVSLASYSWRDISRAVKTALEDKKEAASHLTIPIEEIDKNQMALMMLSAQALVPFTEREKLTGASCDTRLLDIFEEARDRFDGGRKSPIQRRVLGVNFFVKEYKQRSNKKTTMVSEFATKERVTTFERVLYLSSIMQAEAKSQVKSNMYRFNRNKNEFCQRMGCMIGLVVDAFNIFAKTCSYDSVEKMTAPYIIWNPILFKFELIESRSQGYAPKSQSQCLAHCMSPSQDTSETYKEATELPDETDNALRSVAKLFLEELDACVLDGNLTALPWIRQNSVGHPYFIQGQCIISKRLRNLRNSIKEQFPIPSAVTQEWESCDPPSRDGSSLQAQTRPTFPDRSVGCNRRELLLEQTESQTAVHPTCLPAAVPASSSSLPVTQAPQESTPPLQHTLLKHFSPPSEPPARTPFVPPLHRKSCDVEQPLSQPSQRSNYTQTQGNDKGAIAEFVELALQDLPLNERGHGPKTRRRGVAQKDKPSPLNKKEEEVEARMKRFVDTYNCNITEFLERYNERHGLDTQISSDDHPLFGKVQLLLTDPPYGIRASANKRNSDYDTLSAEDMDEVVKVSAHLLRSGGHGIIFCSFQQLNAWRIKISKVKTKEGEDVFSVTPVPYNILMTPGARRSRSLKKKTTTLRSTGEIAVHFVKRGLNRDNQLAMIDYDAGGEVPSRFPGYANTIDNVPDLEAGEQLRFNGQPVRNEQKSVYLMRELIMKHSMPDDVVVDLFSGTYTTAVACMTVARGEHHRFIGCEVCDVAHQLARRRMINTFAKLVIMEDIELKEEEKPSLASLNEIVFTSFIARRDEWRPIDGYPSSTFLPRDNIKFISRVLNDSSIELVSSLIPEQWPLRVQERVLSLPPTTIRAYECMRNHVHIAESSIKSSSAGMGLFASKDLRKNSVLGYYYGPIVYDNLLRRSNSARMYGARMSYVTKSRIQKFAIGLHIDAVKLGLPLNQEIFVVPSIYNVFRFVNDYRYLDDDEEKDSPGVRRKPNIQFWQPDIIDEKDALRSPYNIKVKVIENVAMNSELFIDCGPDYIFPTEQNTKETKLAGKKRKRSAE